MLCHPTFQALQGRASISVDIATQLQRIVALGFNTIELPFSFKALAGAASVAPTQCTLTRYQQLLVSHLGSEILSDTLPDPSQ